jgi:hypothetical protein
VDGDDAVVTACRIASDQDLFVISVSDFFGDFHMLNELDLEKYD